jgi:sortase A
VWVVRWLLFAFGVGCLGFYCSSYLYRTGYQIYEGWRFDQEKTEEAAPIKTRIGLPVMLPDADRGTARTAAKTNIIGRLMIPRLHVSSIVEEGVDNLTLSRAVGHIPGTAFPGEEGNVGVAGHRDTFFRALKDLQPNDLIDFSTHSGRFHYIVESLTVVEPSNVGVLKPTDRQSLTIVTCFPFNYVGNAPRRFIVRAVSTP